jgi:hypothetical protein
VTTDDLAIAAESTDPSITCIDIYPASQINFIKLPKQSTPIADVGKMKIFILKKAFVAVLPNELMVLILTTTAYYFRQ